MFHWCSDGQDRNVYLWYIPMLLMWTLSDICIWYIKKGQPQWLAACVLFFNLHKHVSKYKGNAYEVPNLLVFLPNSHSVLAETYMCKYNYLKLEFFAAG